MNAPALITNSDQAAIVRVLDMRVPPAERCKWSG
jgi:hypothetical protein